MKFKEPLEDLVEDKTTMFAAFRNFHACIAAQTRVKLKPESVGCI